MSSAPHDESAQASTIESLADIELRKTNELLNGNSYWDGFWIKSFDGKVLCVAGSFDRSYYRDVELRFLDTVFFNLPERWADTETNVGSWFRRSSIEELLKTCGPSNNLDQNEVNQEHWFGKTVYAFDLVFSRYVDAEIKRSNVVAFVVASYFEAFKVIVGDGGSNYSDPLKTVSVLSERNRVPMLG
jgi:hypothetical protein